jgi:Flp pilus assembly protein TadD
VYEKAVETNPTDYRIWGNLGAVYSLIPSRQEERLDAYRRAVVLGESELEINPNDPQLLAILAQWYALVGREYDARDAIDRALDIAPNNLQVLQYVAAPLIAIGDTTRSLQVLHPEFQRMVREYRDREEEE